MLNVIVVWLDQNYTRSEEFTCPANWSKDEITKEVNTRYTTWYYYDIVRG